MADKQAMERRSSCRVHTSIPAILTEVREVGSEVRKGAPAPVTIEELSGRGARILSPRPLKVGQLVQLETEDDLFLGEVCHASQSDRGFLAGLELDCALHAASSVRAMMHALLDDRPGHPSGSYAAEAGDERHDQHRRQSRQQNPA